MIDALQAVRLIWFLVLQLKCPTLTVKNEQNRYADDLLVNTWQTFIFYLTLFKTAAANFAISTTPKTLLKEFILLKNQRAHTS